MGVRSICVGWIIRKIGGFSCVGEWEECWVVHEYREMRI